MCGHHERPATGRLHLGRHLPELVLGARRHHDVGPGLGDVGPTCNFAFMSAFEKWVLVLLMLIGRLELYTVLVLFMPAAWRRV